MQGGRVRVIGSDLVSGVDVNLVDIDPSAAVTTSEVDTNGFNATLSGAISGNGGLVKTGSGTLTLTGANTYSGATQVSAGLLQVEGSLSNSSSLTVDSGAALGGSGSIDVATTISGNLTPGSSPGILDFTSGLTLTDSSVSTFEFISDTANLADRGVAFDGVNVSGGDLTIDPNASLALVFNLAGSTVDFSSAFWDSAQSWLLFESSFGTILGSGIFGDVTVTEDSLGQNFNTTTGGFFSLSTIGDDIYLNYAIPEPGSYALIVSLLALLWAVNRRRNTR
jgi:autotransporter-associated beta strand protein